MRASLDLIPFALVALATIVGVATILVLSEVLRRFVLLVIGVLLPADARRPKAEARPGPAVPGTALDPSAEQERNAVSR